MGGTASCMTGLACLSVKNGEATPFRFLARDRNVGCGLVIHIRTVSHIRLWLLRVSKLTGIVTGVGNWRNCRPELATKLLDCHQDLLF